MSERDQQVDLSAEHDKLAAFSIRSTEVRSADEFLELVNTHVRDLLAHEMMICGISSVTSKGSYVHKVLHQNFPLGYLDDLLQPGGSVDSPMMALWRATHEPVVFQSGRDDHLYPAHWVKLFNKYDMRNSIGHGVLDLQGTIGSYFIFSHIPGELGERHVLLMKLIAPHLHHALIRALATIGDRPNIAGAIFLLLSERQRTILYWLHQGKSNSEIASILNMTEANVNYHIDRILMKLEVRNRAQAVARAVDLGLLADHPIGSAIMQKR